MSDHRDRPTVTDEQIARWIVAHPEVWADAAAPVPDETVEAVIADIVSGARQARLETRRRRSRVIAGGIVGAALVVGGAVGVAAISRSGQPTQPAGGIACRAGSDVDSEVVVIDPTDDPVEACAAVWAEGRFDTPSVSDPEVPPLVACISDTGIIEVYPGDSTTCADLGLADADEELDSESRSVVGLQERVIAEINAQPCATATAVEALAQQIVDDAAPVGWRVEIRPDSVDAECVKAAVDPVERVVLIVKFP